METWYFVSKLGTDVKQIEVLRSTEQSVFTKCSYSDRGEVESIRTYMPNSTVNIQNNSYSYYAKTANLHTRKDLKNGRNEEFEYDELDRLTKAWLNGSGEGY